LGCSQHHQKDGCQAAVDTAETARKRQEVVFDQDSWSQEELIDVNRR